jgi:hypothetical protein
MNSVREAIALNVLLGWIFNEALGGTHIPTSQQAMKAAALLAEKAGRTGACFYARESVEAKWNRKNPRVSTKVEGEM